MYLNEDLTSQALIYSRKFATKKRLRQGWKVWTTDENFFVKLDSSLDYIVRINSVEELEKTVGVYFLLSLLGIF